MVAVLFCLTSFTGCLEGDDASDLTTDNTLTDPLSTADAEELSQKFANLTAKYEALAVDLSNLANNYDQALTKNQELSSELSDAMAELALLREDNDEKNSTIAEQEEAIADLKKQLDASDDEIKSLRDSVEDWNNSYYELKSEFSSFEDEVEEEMGALQSNFTILEQEYVTLKDNLEFLEKRMDTLTTMIVTDEVAMALCPVGNPPTIYHTGYDDGSGNGTAGDGILEDEEIVISEGEDECGPKTHSVYEHITAPYGSNIAIYKDYLVIPFYSVLKADDYMSTHTAGYYLKNLTSGEITTLLSWRCWADEMMGHDCSTPSGDSFVLVVSGDLLYFTVSGLNDYDYYKYGRFYVWDGETFDEGLPKPTYFNTYRFNWYGNWAHSFVPTGDGNIFFSAYDSSKGYELHYSNGTATGMVKDICSGDCGGISASLAYWSIFNSFTGLLYFQGSDGTNGDELWRSDGTADGTGMVKDIRSGSSSSYPGNYGFAQLNSKVYFAANDGEHGRELWVTDGSSLGTKMVKDIYGEGSYGSLPHKYFATDDYIFFYANDGSHGYEVWKTDGTEAGTVMVKDISSGSGSSDFHSPVYINNTVYFNAYDGTHGRELWKTDGTEAGTVMVKDIVPGSGDGVTTDSLRVLGDFIYFKSAINSDGSWDYILWKSDGTENGTYPVLEISEGKDSDGHNLYSTFNLDDFLTIDNNVLFMNSRPLLHGAYYSTEIYWFDLDYH